MKRTNGFSFHFLKANRPGHKYYFTWLCKNKNESNHYLISLLKNKRQIFHLKIQTHLLIGHCMVPPEETCGHEVGHHYINRVVVVSQEDTEYPDRTQAPADPVIPPDPPW